MKCYRMKCYILSTYHVTQFPCTSWKNTWNHFEDANLFDLNWKLYVQFLYKTVLRNNFNISQKNLVKSRFQISCVNHRLGETYHQETIFSGLHLQGGLVQIITQPPMSIKHPIDVKSEIQRCSKSIVMFIIHIIVTSIQD